MLSKNIITKIVDDSLITILDSDNSAYPISNGDMLSNHNAYSKNLVLIIKDGLKNIPLEYKNIINDLGFDLNLPYDFAPFDFYGYEESDRIDFCLYYLRIGNIDKDLLLQHYNVIDNTLVDSHLKIVNSNWNGENRLDVTIYFQDTWREKMIFD